MNAGAIRVFKKGVGEASTGNRCFNKNKTKQTKKQGTSLLPTHSFNSQLLKSLQSPW